MSAVKHSALIMRRLTQKLSVELQELHMRCAFK